MNIITISGEMMMTPSNLTSHHPCDTISCNYTRNLNNFFRDADVNRAGMLVSSKAPFGNNQLAQDCQRALRDYEVSQYVKNKMAKDSAWDSVKDVLFPLRNRNMDGTIGAIIDGVEMSPEAFDKKINDIRKIMAELK